MKISILSPVFNEELHIEEMIESVQAQDHQDWEICFVDDGSTDATVAKIQAAAARDPRLRLIAHGSKLGKAAAFNRAYAAATGEVVTAKSRFDLDQRPQMPYLQAVLMSVGEPFRWAPPLDLVKGAS